MSGQLPQGIIAQTPNDGILAAFGITVPADGTGGYSPGAIFLHTDGGAGTAFYVNAGTLASCNFDPIDEGVVLGANVSIADAYANYTGTTLEAALQELGGVSYANRFVITEVLAGTSAASAAGYGKIFVAPKACTVKKISEVHTTASTDGSAVTLHVERLQGTETSGNGDNLHTTGIDLKGTAETPQSPTLLTSGVCALAAGDRLNLVDTGTLTSLAGLCVTVELEWDVADNS